MDTCTAMFTGALFTTARKCIPPRCPLTDEWKMKILYIYPMNFLIHPKGKMKLWVILMDLEIIIFNEVTQSQKERCP